MAKIVDEGKVWFKGAPGPTYAIKVDENYFVIKKKDKEILEHWLNGNKLCVDLHNKLGNTRSGICYPISLEGKTDATLFSGFEKTKHKTVKVVVPEDTEVKIYILKGDDYSKFNALNLDSESFWSLTGF